MPTVFCVAWLTGADLGTSKPWDHETHGNCDTQDGGRPRHRLCESCTSTETEEVQDG